LFVLDKRSMTITLLFFGGLLTFYVFLLAANSSVAQDNDCDQYNGCDQYNEDSNQYHETSTSGGRGFVGTSEPTLPTPVPTRTNQELEEEADSGDAISGASVDNTGDNAALCVPIQQTPITGNQQTEQGNLGVGSEGDTGFGDSETNLNPEQVTNCAQTIQPVSGA
jgi:hypothetical protein